MVIDEKGDADRRRAEDKEEQQAGRSDPQDLPKWCGVQNLRGR